jgi:hypothetical protein
MAKNDFPKTETKDAFGAHGHAKENKAASAYTGFVYPQGGGNDIGVYKQPMPNPNTQEFNTVHSKGSNLDDVRISLGNLTKNYQPDNKFGVGEMRGYGAATKGRKISGKMG